MSKTTEKIFKCPNCKKDKNIVSLFSNPSNLYFCKVCKNGFLYPVPKNLGKFYPPLYWQFPGQLSFIREGLHNLLQKTRRNWLERYLPGGDILDVGAGEGMFGEILGRNFTITNIEAPFAKVKNKHVIREDFLKWNRRKKFDGIVFLESLEHVPSPQDYLKKAASLLKEGGYIFVECPRFDCWESSFFKEKWLHLDLPRHLAHLTRKGLSIIASRNNLKVVSQTGMLIYEFSPYCFIVSLMLYLGVKPLNLREKFISNLATILLALLLLPIGIIVETIFHLFDQDPVEFSVFQRN